jgi:hypothetical protein
MVWRQRDTAASPTKRSGALAHSLPWHKRFATRKLHVSVGGGIDVIRRSSSGYVRCEFTQRNDRSQLLGTGRPGRELGAPGR